MKGLCDDQNSSSSWIFFLRTQVIHKGLTDMLSLAAGISEKGQDTVFLEK